MSDRAPNELGRDVESRRAAARLDRVFLLASLVLLLAMIFPVYALANHVHPILFGLPFGLFWLVCWVIVELFVLCGFYLYESRRGYI